MRFVPCFGTENSRITAATHYALLERGMYEGLHHLHLKLTAPNVAALIPAWAAYRGHLVSPSLVFSEDRHSNSHPLSLHLTRLLRDQDANRLEKELALERWRQRNSPELVSRLSCIYVWADRESPMAAASFWGTQGDHFDDKFLVDVGVSAPRKPTIVDSRWIDRNVIYSSEPLAALGCDWIKYYWSGDPYRGQDGDRTIAKSPLWECLVDGSVTIWGVDLRMRGLDIVKAISPDSLGFLEKGRLGVDLCTRSGHQGLWRYGLITPYLNREGPLRVKHLINADERLVAKINKLVIAHKIPPNEINYDCLKQLETGIQKTPKILDVELDWLDQHPKLKQLLISVLSLN